MNPISKNSYYEPPACKKISIGSTSSTSFKSLYKVDSVPISSLSENRLSLENQSLKKIGITVTRKILSKEDEVSALLFFFKESLKSENPFFTIKDTFDKLKRVELDNSNYEKVYFEILEHALNWLNSTTNLIKKKPYKIDFHSLWEVAKNENETIIYNVIIRCILFDIKKTKTILKNFNITAKINLINFAFYCAEKNTYLLIKILPVLKLDQHDLNLIKKICIRNIPSFLSKLVDLYKNNFIETASSQTTFTYTFFLKALPFLPFRSNKINEVSLNNWIDLHPDELKGIARFLGNNIKHISMNNFFTKLILSINLIKEKLNNHSCFFIAEINKSSEWILELSLPLFEPKDLPQDVLSIDDYIMYLNNYFENNTSLNEPFISNIVFLDDGIYSGEQISSYIVLIAEAIIGLRNSYPKNQIPMPNIYVAPVYSTHFGISNVEQTLCKFTGMTKDDIKKVHIIKNETIKTYGELIQELTTIETNELLDSLKNLFSEYAYFFNTINSMNNEEFSALITICAHPTEDGTLPIKCDSFDTNLIVFLKSIQTNVELKLLKNPKVQLLYLINQIYYSAENSEMNDFEYKKGFASRGNVYFDFKIPDEFSFPDCLADGVIIAEQKERIQHVALLLKTLPPYKPEFIHFKRSIEKKSLVKI